MLYPPPGSDLSRIQLVAPPYDGKWKLSVTGFLSFAGGKKVNRQSFWFEEMKLPEAGE